MAVFLRTILLLLLIAVVAVLVFIYSGLYDVSAQTPHTEPVRWAVDTTLRKSVERRARDIQPPADLGAQQRVQAGARTYASTCVHCHGAIGEEQPPMARHMNPQPPDLARVARQWSAGELYWIVREGLKMTGMPAFGPLRDEEQLWSVVAFVQQLPGMSPETYGQLTAPEGPQGNTDAQQQAGEGSQQDGAQQVAQAQSAAGAAATVRMTGGLEFKPRSVTVRAGEAVEWVNTSQVPHTVTADVSKASDPQHVQLPSGAAPFHSGMIQPGERYRHVFRVPGRYRYFCVPHEGAGMVGEVVVEE